MWKSCASHNILALDWPFTSSFKELIDERCPLQAHHNQLLLTSPCK
jgi:hypothetical protein